MPSPRSDYMQVRNYNLDSLAVEHQKREAVVKKIATTVCRGSAVEVIMPVVATRRLTIPLVLLAAQVIE